MSVSKDDGTMRVNGLLSGLLDRETIATHTLTEKPRTRKDPAKPPLDSVIKQAIIENVLENIPGCKMKDIQGAITAKLASAAKCSKRANEN